MLNPMAFDFVRVAYRRYPEPLARLIGAVDSFAYGAAWPIETILGEHSGKFFDAERLRQAVQKSIWDDSDFYSRGAHSQLVPVFNASGLPPESKAKIFQIVQEEAFARIQQAIRKESSGRERFEERGHHGRQYIARNSAGRLVKEILPPLSKALLHHYLSLKKA